MSAGSDSLIGKSMLQPGRELVFLIGQLASIMCDFGLKKPALTFLSLVPGLSSLAPVACVYLRPSPCRAGTHRCRISFD